MPNASDLPAALAEIPIERIEELEREQGRGFGTMIEEMTSGEWSIGTMRAIVALLDPDRPIATMGDLAAAASELLGKESPGVTP